MPWTSSAARDSALFGLALFAWSANYLFVRVGLLDASPVWLAALRAGTGIVGLGVYFGLSGSRGLLGRGDRIAALLLGIPNTAVFLGLWFVAAAQVPAGEAAVLVYTFPLWVALLSKPLLNHELSPRHWAAVATGFSGIALVSEPWSNGPGAIAIAPMAELLLAAVSWAIATVLFQRRFRPEQMAGANAYQLLCGALVLLGAALVTSPAEIPRPSASLLVTVLWLGLFGTSFAYAVWFFLLGRTPASVLSAYAFLVPLMALALSAGFLGERLDPVQGVGVGMVLVSIYAVATEPRGYIRGDGVSPMD